ncbi:probable membrane-associated kinase regulator 6 [Lycium ferocissimum]|uniref:probable membrane-associated kinase regulator 6 n=1 Tax=Lycium ferocissimum TaxID=112874 RepID=UPI00281608AC|nr:probable membrane-associated kinase regulator 6 [Lycium ferocissimum]
MEDSHQSLSIESFSYSWSVNTKPSNFDSMEEYEEEAAFIEMDPSLSPSKRFSNVNPQDFINFNFPISDQSPSDQELISSTTVSIMKNIEPSSLNSSVTKKEVHTSSRRGLGIFQKLLDFLKPLCQKIRCANFGCKSNSSISTRSVEGIMYNKNWESSQGTSVTPRTSIANYSEDDWRRSCDSESSIYEAVLHCKRTINGDE